MVEKLLQLLITKVDANLFECVKFENFKSSDVEDADEVHFLGNLNFVIWIIYVIYFKDMDNYFTIDYLHGLIDEGTVAEIDKPEEEPVVDCQNTADNYQKKMPQNSQISQNYLLYMVLARAATELRQLSAF